MKLCKGGFKKLLSVGSGRLETMLAAARDGAEEAPYDLRYLHRGCNAELSQKRALVHQYLTQLYNEVAEPMPDGMNSRKRPRHGELRQDPKDLDRSAIKHLPPGTFAEYHSQFEACHPGVKVSRKLFCAEWQAGFLEKLRVRKATHHTKCAQCIARRLIIKQVGHCPPACRAQREEYDKHLKRQYMDRRTYWDVRAQRDWIHQERPEVAGEPSTCAAYWTPWIRQSTRGLDPPRCYQKPLGVFHDHG